MNRKQAEDLIYASYMAAQEHLIWGEADAKKRHPEYSLNLLAEQEDERTVVVTGSKGKGSVTAMIGAILGTRYVTGTMTSPHIRSFSERFRVNGEAITDQEFCEIAEEIRPLAEQVQAGLAKGHFISPMGMQAALATRFFAQRGAQACVLECGKGARYDDVSQVKHRYAVINPVFLEHTRELGKTLEEIGADKSWVIRPETRIAYTAKQEPSVMKILEERARLCQANLKRYGEDFYAEAVQILPEGMCFDVVTRRARYEKISLRLLGEHQAKNCALAFAVCEDIMGELPFAEVKKVLAHLNCPGRLELLCREPLTILDACINRENVRYVRQVLEAMRIERAEVIIGIPEDKDYLGVAACVQDLTDRIWLTRSSNPYYHFSAEQARYLQKNGISCEQTENLQEAMERAKSSGLPILILGTTSLIADAQRWKEEHSSY